MKFGELYLEPSRNGLSRSSVSTTVGTKIVNMGELFAFSRFMNPEMRRVSTTDLENETFGIKVGDLLFARRSLIAEGAGKCSIILAVEEPTVFESSIIRVRLNKNLCSPLFYYYYFSSSLGFGNIQTLVNEVAASGIRSSELAKLKVFYPELETQKVVAKILSRYDDLTELNNQRIKLLEETAKELYKEWFVRMRFPGYKETKYKKGIPEGWEIKELNSFGKIFTGKTPSTKVADFYGGTIPFIKTPDLHDHFYIYGTEECLTEKGNNSQKRSTLPKGSICVSCIGTGGVVGITTAERSQTNQQINSLIPSTSRYLEFLFFAISNQKETIELYGSTGATMTNLSKGKFERLKILSPKDELINRYHKLTKPIFEQVAVLQEENIHLRKFRLWFFRR